MTVPIPPTSGPEDPSIRLAEVEISTTTDIQAPLDGSIAGKMDAAVSAEEGRQQEAAVLAGSAQGFGSGGFNPSPSSEGTHWDTDMSFDHQGP